MDCGYGDGREDGGWVGVGVGVVEGLGWLGGWAGL